VVQVAVGTTRRRKGVDTAPLRTRRLLEADTEAVTTRPRVHSRDTDPLLHTAELLVVMRAEMLGLDTVLAAREPITLELLMEATADTEVEHLLLTSNRPTHNVSLAWYECG
jgi:hypothetical protein